MIGNTPVADPGEWPGGRRPPLFLDQIEARRAEKNFGGDRSSPYLRVWMTAPPPPLSQGLDPYHPSLSLSELNLDTCVNCLRQ